MPKTFPLAGAAAVAVLILLAGCSSTGADEQTRSGSAQGYVGSGQLVTRVPVADRVAIPTLTGPALASGGTAGTVSTANYPGKVLVINVWGSYCPPCREEAAGLQRVSVAKAADAQLVGIDVKDPSPSQGQAFVRTQGVTYPSIFDPSGTVLLQLHGQVPPAAIPSTLVVDRQGRIAIRVLGSISEGTLSDMIDTVAAEQ